MRRTSNGRRIYALADYTVERTGKGWYFGRTSRFGDMHAMKGPYSSERSVIHAEHNVASAFEFARRLLQVKDPQDLFILQTEFIRAQMQAMAEQAKDLSETATKPMMGSVKTPTKGGL